MTPRARLVALLVAAAGSLVRGRLPAGHPVATCVTIAVSHGEAESAASRQSTEAIIAASTGRGRKPKPSTDPGPFRSRSLAPIGWIVAAVFAGVALLFYWMAPDERPIKVRGPATADHAIPPPPALPPPPKVARPRAEPDNPNDVLGRATDFKAVYTRYRDSRDPIERALAGRAHRACFPAFMPPHGKAPSTAYVLNALPKEHREERRAAVEELFARCRSFLVQPLDAAEVVGTAERVTNGDLASAGSAARWALMRGDRAKSEELIEQALRTKEPYAIQSLSGMSTLLVNDGARGAQAEVTDAALALVACDLGASCGANSLLALQLCATEGRCEGTARERMIERLGPVDMEAVEVERKRLRALFDSGRASITSIWRGGR
ncbi:MAG: hypothetical protein WBA53_14585 [Burkholderiaceae bacterium]